LTLAETCLEQRRLAYRAPATALAVNMHLYWMGIASDLLRAGDRSLQWLLDEGAAGEVFSAGHAEVGNDLPGLLSTASATRVDGGYKVSGHKMFGSLTPVWTRFGGHAMDTSDPQSPKVIHFFMPRDTPGLEIKETWDTLGMRPTRSDDTILHDAFVPDHYIGRVLPAGTLDQFLLSLFANALLNFANIYYAVCPARAIWPSLARTRRPRSRSRGRWPTTRRYSTRPPRWRSRSKLWAPTSSASHRTGQTASTTAPSGRPRSWPPSTTPWRAPSAS
jgi:hypothetical protein